MTEKEKKGKAIRRAALQLKIEKKRGNPKLNQAKVNQTKLQKSKNKEKNMSLIIISHHPINPAPISFCAMKVLASSSPPLSAASIQ